MIFSKKSTIQDWKPFANAPEKACNFLPLFVNHDRSKIHAMPLLTFLGGVDWEAEHWAKTRLTNVPQLMLHNLSLSAQIHFLLHRANDLTTAKWGENFCIGIYLRNSQSSCGRSYLLDFSRPQRRVSVWNAKVLALVHLATKTSRSS